MRSFRLTILYAHIIGINTQYVLDGQFWHYRLPQDQQYLIDPFFMSYNQHAFAGMPMPMYGFSPNPYPMAYTIPTQQFVPVETFASGNFPNHPFRSTWKPDNSISFANQNEYIGYVTEIKSDKNILSTHPAPFENSSRSSVGTNSYLPNFLQGTSDEIQKEFREIISNPNENYQQKQSKLDQLVSKLDSKNQELYDQYRRDKEKEEKEKRERVHAIVANMSQKAQAVFAKLSAVLMNPEMKDGDRMNKINDFYNNVDEEVKKEFKERIRDLN